MRITRTILLVPALLIPASAQAQMPATTVDLCLVLAADISASISISASRTQREGHAEALTHPEVLAAIARTRTGRIAVTYIEWSGHETARTVLPWQVIENTDDAKEAAKVIRDESHRSQIPGHTSISWAITFAARSLSNCPAKPDRTVIDISVNGPNNDGRPVAAARNEALASGHTINALVIPAQQQSNKDLALSLDPDEGAWQTPVDYLHFNVTGGPNSFATTAATLDDYASALRRKIIAEIAGSTAVDGIVWF